VAEPLNSPQADPRAGEPEERARSRVGATIRGKWHLDALLGVGGMAAVFAASHRNGQRAALKILHADFARDRIVCERFLREAYVSNKIGHPACVRVLDDDMTEEEEPFLVMELLEGETVREAWKRSGKVMPVAEVLRIADTVLDCLIACHAIGVIHRDLKPANLFITSAGQVKVLDFGVAQMRSATNERTAAGTALGTPAYMSPEQAMGLVDQLDGRADIFSVGAMLHALITGQRINNGRTEQEALVMAATMPVASVARIAPDLPLPVVALVDKALAWDRRNRFDDARQMQAAVRDALGAVQVETFESAPAPRASIPDPPRSARAADWPGARGGMTTPAGGTSKRSAIEAARQGSPIAPAAATSSKPAPEPVAAENDPRVETARELLRHLDRIFPSVRQFGWAHPATDRALRTAFEAFAEALAKQPVVALGVRPYSLEAHGNTVWEPGPPFDAIPYNLFASGIRTLRLTRGLTSGELTRLLELLLLDPARDLPPEDDLLSALWERAIEHVSYEAVDTLAEGDASEREEFYGQADEVEAAAADAARRANTLEAKAMAVSTDRAALTERVPSRERSPMGLDDVVRAVFAAQLDVGSEKWSERYVDALALGYLDAATNRDAPLVLASLRKSAADLVVAGRLKLVLSLHDALAQRLSVRVRGEDYQRLSAALTNALFGAETLELSLKRLQGEPAEVPLFEPVLNALWAAELPTALAALAAIPLGPLRDALSRFVERVLPGHEAEVAQSLGGMEPTVAVGLVALLGRAGTADAKRALAQLASSDDPTLRIEAKVLLASSAEQVQGELMQLLESGSALVRMAAQRAVTRHGLKAAWTAIARQVRAPNFHELGADERRQLLNTLVALSPDRGEPMAVEFVKKGGVFTSEDRETSRALAAEALGEWSRLPATVATLREVSQTRWGTSDETRAAAAAAAKKIVSRLEEEGAPS
jgi:serine/threonine protein kinase